MSVFSPALGSFHKWWPTPTAPSRLPVNSFSFFLSFFFTVASRLRRRNESKSKNSWKALTLNVIAYTLTGHLLNLEFTVYSSLSFLSSHWRCFKVWSPLKNRPEVSASKTASGKDGYFLLLLKAKMVLKRKRCRVQNGAYISVFSSFALYSVKWTFVIIFCLCLHLWCYFRKCSRLSPCSTGSNTIKFIELNAGF